MPRLVPCALVVCLGAFIGTSPVLAEIPSDAVGQGTFGLGVNYPGLGARYFLSDRYALEAKGQVEKDIDLGGLRVYRYFRPTPRVFLFAGAEADYVHFRGSFSAGSGDAGEIFGGLEYFILPRLSVQTDFGPSYVYLKDRDASLSAGGLEFVMNFGINYYFERGRGTPAKKRDERRMKLDPWALYHNED